MRTAFPSRLVALLVCLSLTVTASQHNFAQTTSPPTLPAADDAATYYALTARDLGILNRSTMMEEDPAEKHNWTTARRWRLIEPRVLIDAPDSAEAYVIEDLLGVTPSQELADIDRFTIVLRSKQPPSEVSGVLLLPDRANRRVERIGFRAPAATAAAKHRESFYLVQSRRYHARMSEQLPGQAWFRYRAAMADAVLSGALPQFQASITAPRIEQDVMERSYALFSGGQAVSENLQLDRLIDATESAKAEPRVTDVETLPGITVAAINWKPWMPRTKPPADPLAAFVPHDQHVVFFPSFQQAVFVADKVREQGTWLVSATRDQSQSRGVFDFYQSQLGISLDALSRLIGDRLVRSVALTGSDPYYNTGTDIAVLLETDQPTILRELLLAQITTSAQQHQLAIQNDNCEGVSYQGARSPTQTFRSYLAQLGSTIVVTNSPEQLRRLVEVHQRRSPSLAELDEYTVFRDRYRVGDPAETAFAFLSDDTIRRWCGPRWRIATARRTRDAAVLADLTARQIDQSLPSLDTTDAPTRSFSQPGSLLIQGSLVHHETIGNLRFLTPIIELDTALVTASEAESYERWRTRYQRNWRWAFDPIGMRVTWTPRQVAADVTVMPLIASSEYAQLVELSRGAAIVPGDGDPHKALLHMILAVNKDSERFGMFANSARRWGFPNEVDPLAWLDRTVALYVDDDPLWQELAQLTPAERNGRFEEFIARVPVALRADVSNGMRLTAFLVAFRAWVDQTAPGMLDWQAFEYNSIPYVRIGPTELAAGMNRWTREFQLYYCASGRSLIVTPNEAVLKSAIDRDIAALAQSKDAKPNPPVDQEFQQDWLGSNVAVQVSSPWLDIWEILQDELFNDRMQRQSWDNIPILNEWHRRFSDQDPRDFHRRYWHADITCPGGGQYVWNDQWQTMESTVYGHPEQPKAGPALPTHLRDFRSANFGLTFEEQGLRGRVELLQE